ncbi:alpha/beta fold hydrolase [Phreatobacter sp. HK31-P]
MIPVTFNGLMGKLHLPDGVAPSGIGVVIVPPHGVEALAATKSLRVLADALAAAGHAALRFDLPGTADSLGDDTDPERLTAWTASVGQAAEVLRRHAGVSAIVFAGLRFGATIATLAAQSDPAPAGLLLLDPIVKGRSYARELAMTARAVAEGARLNPDDTVTDDGLLIAGLPTTNESLDAIRKIDLCRLETTPVPTLLLHRRNSAEARILAEAWRARHGLTVMEAQDFEAISLSPTMAATPSDVIARSVAWVSGLPRGDLVAPVPSAAAMLDGPHFREEAMTFGEGNRLFGVICQPRAAAPGKPVLLIVNAGRNSHVGWARSSVLLARELAAEGIASLRMDLAGIGDGQDRPGADDTVDAVLYHPANDAQMADAVDLLAARGFGQVTVLGACSGAYLALHHAARDPRITGLILVNIQRFVWRPGETVEQAIASAYPLAASYAAKVLEARAWKRLLTGERKIGPLIREFGRRFGARLRAVAPSEQTKVARDMVRKLAERRVPVELMFSENDAGLGDMALHFGANGRWLTARDNLHLTIIPGADHDLTPPAARRTLVARALAAARGKPQGD